MSQLQEVLNKMRGVVPYRDKDIKALNMSRSASAGKIDDPEYAEYAGISNDPWVSIDMVKTFARTFKNKLAGSPFRPRSDKMYAMGKVIKLDGKIENAVEATMNDGFDFHGVGFKNGIPLVIQFDARYVLYDGEDPTLKDCKNFVAFRIEHKSFEEMENNVYANYPSEFVRYDPTCEKVITYHYHTIEKEVPLTDKVGQPMLDELGNVQTEIKNVWVKDTYKNYDAEPEREEIPNIDRVPVVRFTGERVELSDKRWHYRGLYWTMGSLQKALCCSATKVQTRIATEDDANWTASSASIANNAPSWDGQGVRQYDVIDVNGKPIDAPKQIVHDNQFLVSSFNIWKDTMQMMLNPIAISKSDAVSEEEVRARNEVRDAICNAFLRPAQEAVAEIYRLINSMYTGDNSEVEIVNGFLENEKRSKEKSEAMFIYNIAKESGLNTQGFAQLFVDKSDLDSNDKEYLLNTFKQDPMASPKVVQLNAQIQQLNNTIQQMTLENTMLKNRVADRIERNDNYIAQQERKYRSDLAFRYWQEEQKQTTNALMEVLKQAMSQGNNELAMQIVDRIMQQSPNPLVQQDQVIDAYADENMTTQQDITMRGNPNMLGQQTIMGGANVGGQQPMNQSMQNAVNNVQQQQREQLLAQRLAKRGM